MCAALTKGLTVTYLLFAKCVVTLACSVEGLVRVASFACEWHPIMGCGSLLCEWGPVAGSCVALQSSPSLWRSLLHC